MLLDTEFRNSFVFLCQEWLAVSSRSFSTSGKRYTKQMLSNNYQALTSSLTYSSHENPSMHLKKKR